MAATRWQSGTRGGSELQRLRQEVDQLFNSITAGDEPFFSRVYPALNLSEDAENYYVRAELPGVNPESLDISVVEGRLLIRGERKESSEEREVYYHRRERESGFFRRSLNLPGKVASDKVSAHLKNGVLTVVLPKPEEAKPRKIAVQMT